MHRKLYFFIKIYFLIIVYLIAFLLIPNECTYCKYLSSCKSRKSSQFCEPCSDVLLTCHFPQISVIVTKFKYLGLTILMAELITSVLNGTPIREDESIRLLLEDCFGEDLPTSTCKLYSL